MVLIALLSLSATVGPILQVHLVTSTRQEVTTSTTPTTTASSSELAPRQQPEACWLWVPTAYVSGLLVPFGSCLYSDLYLLLHGVMLGLCPLSDIRTLLSI